MAAAGTSDSVRKPDFELKVADIVAGPDEVKTAFTKRQARRLSEILGQMLRRAYATKTDQVVRFYDSQGGEEFIALDADTVTADMLSGFPN
jgi:hypothetical protein